MIVLTNVNLNKNELQNAVIQPLASAPSSPKLGQIYFNSGTKKLMQYDGSAWGVVGMIVEVSTNNGKIKVDGSDVTVYTLPKATSNTLGGIKVGSRLSIDNDGVLSADAAAWSDITGKPSIPANTSDLNNDSGFITINDVPEGAAASNTTPKMDGTAAKGTETAFARGDHVHPTDTTRVGKATNPTTGNFMSFDSSGNAADSGKKASDFAEASHTHSYLPLAGGTMTGAIAMGSNKITGLADGVNNGDAVTKGQLDAAKLGALKPSGSVAFASLPALTASVLNNLYNVTDAFTTTSDFVEGSGKSYPAGTNVAVINTGTAANPVYKFDAMTGIVDLSGYLPTNGDASSTTAAFTAAGSRALPSTGETLAVIFGKILKYLTDLKTVAFTGSYSDLTNKPTEFKVNTATLSTSETSKSITATGSNVANVQVVDSSTHERVMTDVTINGSSVTVTVAAAPTNALSITVLSY